MTNLNISNPEWMTQDVKITNEEFLKGISGDRWEQVYAVGFRTVVDDVVPADWVGSAAGGRRGEWYGSLEDREANQYFCVSLFEPGVNGLRRSKKTFKAQCVLVLDDLGIGDAVGGKADLALLDGKLEPSYMLETSRDNFQVGYILDMPCEDADLADRLVKAMIKDGLGLEVDPGMQGVTRLVRMPQGINNKRKHTNGSEPWQCKLRTWKPELRYSIEDIVESWGLVLEPPRSGVVGAGAGAGGEGGSGENSGFVWELLQRLGMVGPAQSDGYYQVPCPNQAAHTIDDGRTGYAPGEGGGFKCFHGSCAHLTAKDLTNALRKGYPAEWKALQDEMYPVEKLSVDDMFPPIVVTEGAGVASVAGAPVIRSAQDAMLDLLHRARQLTDTDGLQQEAEAILREADALRDPMALERILDAMSGTGFLTKKVLEKYLKRYRAEEKQKRKQSVLPPGPLVRDWVFCRPDGRFYNVVTKVSCSLQAFNQAEEGIATMDGEQIPASHVFKDEGGARVDGLTWMPCPMNRAADLLVNTGRKVMLNVYEEPVTIDPCGSGSRLGMWWDLVCHILPRENERTAVLQHLAATIQHPERKIDWQILLHGGIGIGKDALFKPMMRYFGSAATEVSKEELAAGWGNTRAGKKVLLFSEVWRPRDRQFANSIKTLAASTASGLDKLNLKGGAIIEQPNLYSIYAMSNHEDALHLEPGERRWFVVEAFRVKPLDQRFYNQYHRWLEDEGGWVTVVSWLMALDLREFSWGRLPFRTEATDALRVAGRTTAIQHLADLMDARDFPFQGELISLGQIEAYLMTNREFSGNGGKVINQQILKKDLQEIGCIPLKHRGRRTAIKDGKKIQHWTPVLYTLDDPTPFDEMTGPELYDYCPAELFVNSHKRFDVNGELIENTNSGETRH